MRSLIILLIAGALVAADAPPIAYLANAGVHDLKAEFGAKGDGASDDTAAFKANSNRRMRTVYVPRTLPRRGGTWVEWFQACQGGEPAGCQFDWAGRLTETVLLGNIAIRSERRLEWDAPRMKFPNFNDAEQYLQSTYQNGWSL